MKGSTQNEHEVGTSECTSKHGHAENLIAGKIQRMQPADAGYNGLADLSGPFVVHLLQRVNEKEVVKAEEGGN